MVAYLNNFYSNFAADPLVYIGAVIVFFAAIGFLIFLRGFFNGVPRIFVMSSGHTEYKKLARIRCVWGFFLLFAMYLLWEIILWAAAWWNGNPAPNLGGLLIFTLVFVALYYIFIKKKKEE